MKSYRIVALAAVLGVAIAATAQTPSPVVIKGTVLLTNVDEPNTNSTPAVVVKGMVLLPNGEPAAGADVGLQVEGGHLMLALNKAWLEKGVEMRADADGQFSFSTEKKPLNVYALNAQGYAMISAEALATAQKIVLQPWGRIEGILKLPGESGSNWFISIFSVPAGNPIDIPPQETITGSNGQFTIRHVPPGAWQIGGQVVERGGGAKSLPNLARTITVKPGETTRVEMAVTGQIIIGKLAAKTGQADINWREASVALSNGAHTYGSPDGSFRFIGVPAGTYQLNVAVVKGSMQPPSPGMRDYLVIAESSRQVIVPETAGGQNSKLLDLGVIMLNPVEPPRVAPHL